MTTFDTMSDFEERQKQAASMTTTDLIRAGNHEMIVKLTGQLAAEQEKTHQLREALLAVECAYPVPEDVENDGACPACFTGTPLFCCNRCPVTVAFASQREYAKAHRLTTG
jgi:hypothetical protein